MNCDICFSNEEEIKQKKCCGINICYLCDFKALGFCYIHEREKINIETECEECGKICSSISTSGICEICDKNLCMECIGIYELCSIVCKNKSCLEGYWKNLNLEVSGYECDCNICLKLKEQFIKKHSSNILNL
tara:strand:+ start:170 stop:568 length:399 start_codon:yes stop_codon:yes gene_type:complete